MQGTWAQETMDSSDKQRERHKPRGNLARQVTSHFGKSVLWRLDLSVLQAKASRLEELKLDVAENL